MNSDGINFDEFIDEFQSVIIVRCHRLRLAVCIAKLDNQTFSISIGQF